MPSSSFIQRAPYHLGHSPSPPPLSFQRRRVSETSIGMRGPSAEDEVKRLETLVCELLNKLPQERKRKRSSNKSTACLGRGFRKLVHISDDPATVVIDAQAHGIALEDEDTVQDIQVLQEMDEEELEDDQKKKLRAWQAQERNLATYGCFTRLIPNLEGALENSDPAAISNFYAEIKKGAGEARSDDISSTSRYLGSLLNKCTPAPNPHFGTFGRDVRANRGINHDTCLRLMLPIDWEDTEDVRQQVREHELGLSDTFFIRLFYEGLEGNAEDLDEGFLKSKILVLLYKHVFTSPSSATGELEEEEEDAPPQKKSRASRAMRGPVAAILMMRGEVTPRSIAYICVLAYFALTDASHWTLSYNGINFTDVYNFIVDYFEDTPTEAEKEQAQDLLKWWNRQIFENYAPHAQSNAAASTSREVLRAQRRAKWGVLN